MTQYKVAVLGGGSFGTVIANLAASNGHATTLWLRDPQQLADMREHHENTRYLPGFPLAPELMFSDDLQATVAAADVVFVSIPSKAFRSVLKAARPAFRPEQMLVSTTKGIEKDSFALMSEILREESGLTRIGVISGPNLAKEIMARQLAGTVVASPDEGLRTAVHAVLSCAHFRVFSNSDIYGVELSGALKNIYAVASGMAAAHKLGENTRAMLLTRSLAEMSRFAVHLGANPLTFLGLAGVGDLVATCSSPLSRNYQVGFAIGQGQTLEEIVEELEQTAEGINTIQMVRHKADELGIRMPLVTGLHEIIFNKRSLYDVVLAMMLGSQSSDVEFVLPKPGEA
ncbi:NAD(P)H-dependent glycerol-3-phosphate dehydrogenase [Amnimonas aquatica]|uniref:Glycerol-3-phosphate dehydrogenase [NAD(P)+] n=1 Tax=Amnimonas aquatica TaxID=2094561 RepID=A0A2P6ASJ7_9GAMM|nr:NAD(P)H-dependent glycerol-3-phosphate dehydrogenase [Amnimonas aquatica]PQA43127.1 NAD(P)H-dependent glycerol-3-phosphate dehydrogenase [Amnimonas aquatica]